MAQKKMKRSFQDLYQDCERFHIPGTNPQEENLGLRVGKFDSLITLSDEMRKLDLHCEATARKISNQYLELTEESKEVPKEFDVKSKGASPVSFLTKFQWEKARFSTKKSLPELTRIVEVGMAKIDAELRSKTTEYNALGGKLRQITQSTQGNLLSRDITKEIETSKFIESNYLTAIYVVVPTNAVSDWLKCYTDLVPDFVVPNTSELLCEEHDFSLFKVVLFKHVVDDFKIKAKEKRFIVRKYDPSNTTSEVELGKLKAKYEKLGQGLERWCQTNFAEAYFLWIHLKAIQCYVESILRYGLPADFDVILMQPKKEKITALEKQLHAKYAHLEKMFGEDEEEEEGHQQQQQEKYYPYVFLEVPTSFF